jgi:hypothetical protein
MSESDGKTDDGSNVWINSDGTFGDLSKAPEGVGEFITKKGWKDLPAMAQSHQELESKLGDMTNMVRIPAEDDVEGWRKLSHEHLGCPATPEEYQYTPKDGDPYDENLISLFKQAAYRDGMPQKAFSDVVDFQIAAIKETNKMYEEKLVTDKAEAQKAIRGRFNTEDEYNAYTQKALGFADKFQLKDGKTTAADVLERTGLAYDPQILEVFGTLADTATEDSLQFSKARVTPNRDEQLKAITSDPAFVKADHPDHQKVMEEYWAYFKSPQEG